MIIIKHQMNLKINNMKIFHHQIIYQIHQNINQNDHVLKQKKLIVQLMMVFGYKNNIIMH